MKSIPRTVHRQSHVTCNCQRHIHHTNESPTSIPSTIYEVPGTFTYIHTHIPSFRADYPQSLGPNVFERYYPTRFDSIHTRAPPARPLRYVLIYRQTYIHTYIHTYARRSRDYVSTIAGSGKRGGRDGDEECEGESSSSATAVACSVEGFFGAFARSESV